MALDVSIEESVALEAQTLPKRVLGKTGERVPVLGLGTGPGGMGLADDDAVALYHCAIDLGVTYVDTAPGYDRAQVQLGRVMADRRDEVFLVTKTLADDAEKALQILEKSLEDLQTDCVDLVYVHSMGNRDVDRVLASDGALVGLREAQKRGWTRYIGVTAHNTPHKAVRVLEEADIDVIMLAMNPADLHTYNFEGTALPLAQKKNVGVAAMKVYGGAVGMKYQKPVPSALTDHGSHDHEAALRYALGLPGVATAVIGVFNEKELRQNVAWAKKYTPLSASELAELEEGGKTIAADWGPHYGSVE